MPAARPKREFDVVKRLLGRGLSDYEVARQTGVPRGTVLNWRRRSSAPGTNGRQPVPVSVPLEKWRPKDVNAHCYLLGLYLGDGCIMDGPRHAPRLVLALDAGYPAIITQAMHAIEATLPGISVCVNRRTGSVAILASHPIWPYAYPQHGRGRKHTRRIELVDWQTATHPSRPRPLIRGLIHSDGSRVINRFKTRLPSGRIGEYAYVRYFFTNYSADIRRIFCEHCYLLGIRWTQSSFKNISVAHRDSVAILDSFVGPKR